MQMNTLHINHVKIDRRNSFLRYNHLRKITNLFRVIEFLLLLIVLSQFTFRVPPLFKLSGEYFRSLCIKLLSPRFVFVLGNAIVIILFAKSGQFGIQNTKTDIYEQEYKKIQGKQNPVEEKKVIMASVFPSDQVKICRSKSEKKVCEKACSVLRRSKTGSFRKCCRGTSGEEHYPEDHMSSEEFRETVEAFIARQQRSLREEEFIALG